MARNEPSGSGLDPSRRRSLAALYLRVATTLERSAGLAEQHAARVSSKGQDQLARVELERAERARAGARLLSRPGTRSVRAPGPALHPRREQHGRQAAAHCHNHLPQRMDGERARPGADDRGEKRASTAAYGDRGPLRRYEYDHLIPLELGGAVDEPRNLWPEPGASPNRKARLEEWLNGLVCRGDMALRTAQQLIVSNWAKAYRQYVSPGGTR